MKQKLSFWVKGETQFSETVARNPKARNAGASKKHICSENQVEIRMTFKRKKSFRLIVRTVALEKSK